MSGIQKINAVIFKHPADHPARMFLEQFIRCNEVCVGREVGETNLEPIDQSWLSKSESKQMRFSDIAYSHISFTIELDGWIHQPSQLTDSEKIWLESIPKLKTWMYECKEAATGSKNSKMLPLIDEIEKLLVLWEQCIIERTKGHKS